MPNSQGMALHHRGDLALSQSHKAATSRSKQRDPSYLFACQIAWRDQRDIKAYEQLVAALDDPSEELRAVAEHLLHRPSPRPQPKVPPAAPRHKR